MQSCALFVYYLIVCPVILNHYTSKWNVWCLPVTLYLHVSEEKFHYFIPLFDKIRVDLMQLGVCGLDAILEKGGYLLQN